MKRIGVLQLISSATYGIITFLGQYFYFVLFDYEDIKINTYIISNKNMLCWCNLKQCIKLKYLERFGKYSVQLLFSNLLHGPPLILSIILCISLNVNNTKVISKACKLYVTTPCIHTWLCFNQSDCHCKLVQDLFLHASSKTLISAYQLQYRSVT